MYNLNPRIAVRDEKRNGWQVCIVIGWETYWMFVSSKGQN